MTAKKRVQEMGHVLKSIYDLGYVNPQTPMNSRTLHANKDSQVYTCPSWAPERI